jgi:hypothetical protein
MSGEHGMDRLKTQMPASLACPGALPPLRRPLLPAPLLPPPPAPPLLVLPLGLANATVLVLRGVLPGVEGWRALGLVTGAEGGRAVLAACTSVSGSTRSVSILKSHPEMKSIHDAVAPPGTA